MTARGSHLVDDSKATNPHAAAASMKAYHSVVWVVGGLLKGVDVGRSSTRSRPAPRAAVVVIGADRRPSQAFARHAPGVPFEVGSMTLMG